MADFEIDLTSGRSYDVVYGPERRRLREVTAITAGRRREGLPRDEAQALAAALNAARDLGAAQEHQRNEATNQGAANGTRSVGALRTT